MNRFHRKLSLAFALFCFSMSSCTAVTAFKDSAGDLNILGLMTTVALTQSIGCGETSLNVDTYTVTIFPARRGECDYSGKSYSEYLVSRYNYFQRSLPSAAHFSSLHADCSASYLAYVGMIGSPESLASNGVALSETDYNMSLFYRIEDPISEAANTIANELSITVDEVRANYWATDAEFLHLLPGYIFFESPTSCMSAVMAEMSAYKPGFLFQDGRDLSFTGPTGWTVMMSDCRYGPGAVTNQCATIQ